MSNDYIDPFTVVCLVTWLLNESDAAVDLVLIETSGPCDSYFDDAVLMLIYGNNKSSEVSIKTKSTSVSL